MTKHDTECSGCVAAGPQLFLDDWFIESMRGLQRLVCPPVRHAEPVLPHTPHHLRMQPWFTVRYQSRPGNGTPADDDGHGELSPPRGERFRLWYALRIALPDANGLSSDAGVRHAYAESANGVNWVLPELGLHDVPGWDCNNLLPTRAQGATGYALSLIDNGPGCADPARRYMMMSYQGVTDKTGAWALFSPDGLQWTAAAENPVVPYRWSYGGDWSDGRQVYVDGLDVFFDPLRKRYVLIHVMVAQPEDGYVGFSRTGPTRRILGQLESEDFVHWSRPRVIMTPSNKEDMTEYYSMSVLVRNGLYIGFPRILRDDLPADPGGPVEGIGWTELATSRDGTNWTRLPGVFLDRRQALGTWDHAMAWMSAPVTLGDEMFFYYSGYDQGHKVGRRQIGLARAARDRFVALATQDATPGVLLSRVCRTACERLTLNAAAAGEIRVQLRDRNGQVLEGYALKDCDPIQGDAVAHPVRWGGKQELPGTKAEGLRIEITLRSARLFGVDFEDT